MSLVRLRVKLKENIFGWVLSRWMSNPFTPSVLLCQAQVVSTYKFIRFIRFNRLMHFIRLFVASFAALSLSFTLTSPATAGPTDDMKSLIEQGRFQEAYALGIKHEKLSGEPVYDYYFGIAAIDSGRASLGVLSLERVLLSNPNNDLARLELARGYFVIGDYERAREEFTFMQSKQIPAEVRSSIEKYLAEIRKADPQFRTTPGAYIEFGLGHNTNVNTSTNQQVPFPIFGQFSPPIYVDPGASKPSMFNQLALGGMISGPIVPGVKYLGSLDVMFRQHAQVPNFDQRTITGSGGAEFDLTTSKIRALGYVSEAGLDGKHLRTTTGLVTDWVKPIDAATTFRSALGFASLRYNQDLKGIRDANMPSFAIGVNRLIGGPLRSTLDVELTAARENNIRGQNDLTRNIFGARVGLGFVPNPRTQAGLIASYTKSRYGAPEPLAPEPNIIKDDGLLSLEANVQYQMTKGWSVRGEYIFLRNLSNVTLYAYEQQVALMKLRYEWK